MPREYTNIARYSEKILDLKSQGYTRGEIAERVGLSKDQIHQFFCRYHRNQRKIAAGKLPKRKGRPPQTERIEDELQRLRMENELMRDFLSLTERK